MGGGFDNQINVNGRLGRSLAKFRSAIPALGSECSFHFGHWIEPAERRKAIRDAQRLATESLLVDAVMVHANEASDRRSQVIYLARTDPTTTRPASLAKGPDASRPRMLGLPARRTAPC